MMNQTAKQVTTLDGLSMNQLMVMSIGQKNYYIAQEDISTFESIHELGLDKEIDNTVGYISEQGKKIPVYYLSPTLDFVTDIPESTKICVILNHINMALMCDEIRVMNTVNYKIMSIPECMYSDNSPLDSFCVFKNNSGEEVLGMILSAHSIQRYIEQC